MMTKVDHPVTIWRAAASCCLRYRVLLIMPNQQSFERQHVMAVLMVLPAVATLPFGESVIGVQIDAIARDFRASALQVQWIINAFMLTFATSILAAGVLADRFGRYRLFGWGLILSLVGNTAAAFAPSTSALVLWRAFGGLGSGIIMATAPALLSVQFAEPGRRRAIAFASFGAAAGSGIALGPLLGGLIMTAGGWRAVFLVYLPFLLISGFFLWRGHQQDSYQKTPVDVAGMAVFTLALALLIWLIQSSQGGMHTATLAIAIALLLLLLVAIERRHPVPAIDPLLFTHPVFGAMSLLTIIYQISIAVSM